MATTLILLCCAATASARAGAFPSRDEPLDGGGLRKARERLIAPSPDLVLRSPARAACETAAAMGLAAGIDPLLADRSFGEWEGRALAEVHALRAGALEDWIAWPERGTPSGETLGQVRARLRPWLAAMAREDRGVVAITHAWIVRALLAEALHLSDRSATQVDVAPLSAARLSFRREWRLQSLGD